MLLNQQLHQYLQVILWVLLFHFTTPIRACNENLKTANKQLQPAYAAILNDVTNQRHLSLFFAGSACSNVTSSIQHMRTSFSDCFWHCQTTDSCVAFRHEGGTDGDCMACYVDPDRADGAVNWLTEGLDLVDIDVRMQMRYFVSIGHLTAMNVKQLTNCSEVKELVPNSEDGEYCLSMNGTHGILGTRIYCSGFNTSAQLGAYLTLPAGSEDNFSFTYKGDDTQEAVGRIEYAKLGLDLANMRINASDETFTVRDIINEDFDGVSDAYPAYGMAFGCSALTTGRFSIDLTGTGFYIPNTVTWLPYGSGSTDIVYQNQQQIYGECWGGCGGCAPSTALPGYAASAVGAYMVYAASRVIDLGYDASLDETSCTPDWVVIY